MFTGIDVIISIILMSMLLLGLIRGFVGSIVDLIGITAGITLASIVYKAPVNLLSKFRITGNAVELTCFLTAVFFLVLGIIFLLEILRKRVDIKHIVDRLFGILPGILEGFIFAGVILISMSVSFRSAMEIRDSRVSKYIIKYLPAIYEKTDRMGITIPKMIYLPHKYPDEFKADSTEIRFWKVNFARFEGFTCMECGGKVKFKGYFLRIGATMVPKFACEKCGRTSCGCQTYKGFHKIYQSCPIDLAKEKFRFDCGRWPNYKLITPRGPCPVDSKQLDFWEWEPPTTY